MRTFYLVKVLTSGYTGEFSVHPFNLNLWFGSTSKLCSNTELASFWIDNKTMQENLVEKSKHVLQWELQP